MSERKPNTEQNHMNLTRIYLAISVSLISALHAQKIEMYHENEKLGLRIPTEAGHTHKLLASEDLITWKHLVSLRNPTQVDWPLRTSELNCERLFFQSEKVVATGLENLKCWQAFRSAEDTGRFQIALIGDSFTHARDRYAKRLKQNLATRYGNLGAGYLGFGYAQNSTNLFTNGSIDETQLNYTIPTDQWTYQYGNGYGPDACHVVALVPNAQISIQVKYTVEEMKIYYVTKLGSLGFRYRIAGGGVVLGAHRCT
jgi:hypothetical protein